MRSVSLDEFNRLLSKLDGADVIVDSIVSTHSRLSLKVKNSTSYNMIFSFFVTNIQAPTFWRGCELRVRALEHIEFGYELYDANKDVSISRHEEINLDSEVNYRCGNT